MGTLLAYKNVTLAEATKREGYDDEAAVLGELAPEEDFLDEVPWYPASNGAYHKFLQGKRLGVGAFSKANAPVPSISSQADELTEPVKLYEGDSEIDERVLNGVKNKRAVRDSEDMMNLKGMLGDWIYNLVYTAGDPDGFKALTARRPSLGDYCLGVGGGGSDLSSMWIFEFGPAGFHLRYNTEGSPGIKNEDRGRHKVTAPTGSGNYWAWIRHYEIWAAIVLRNERAMIRLANIESAGSSNNLIDNYKQVIKAKNILQNVGRNAMGFVNRTVKAQIDTAAFEKSNALLTIQDIKDFGPMTMFAGLPVRMMGSLLDTETAITA